MANGKITTADKKLILKRYSYTFPDGMQAGKAVRIASNAMSPSYHFPNGYTPIAIRYYNTGSAHLVLDYLLPYNQDTSSSNYIFAVRNIRSSDITTAITFTVDILFAPDEMVEIITS